MMHHRILPIRSFIWWFAACIVAMCGSAVFAADEPGSNDRPSGAIVVHPQSLVLKNPRQSHSILVTANSADGRSLDLTSQAAFTSADESIAKVDTLGWVTPQGTGDTLIRVAAAGQTVEVKVSAALPAADVPYSFLDEVMPVLSKAGCNSGACHGYSLGKNGFKLSLRGADAGKDFDSITHEFFSRRINRYDPPASLLLTKPVGDVAHEGGVRFDRGSLMHELLLGWIRDGARPDAADLPTLVSIRVHPEQIVLTPGTQHQLQLLATYSDGSIRDVTRLGIFTANNSRFATVSDDGLVTAEDLGETAIVVRYERKFVVTGTIVLPASGEFQPAPVPADHLIDRFVAKKLNALKITPSEIAGDAMFLRRIYLDVIGLQPMPDELQAFLADKNPNKRAKVIDTLFARPEFVDHWSLKWGDLLQNSRNVLSAEAVFAFREWIRSAVASNMPMDEFARQLLTSRGGPADHPASAYFAISKDTSDTLERSTQVFCGVRMLCAKCHPHPFENWTQTDYYGLATFFNQVGTKRNPRQANDAKAKVVTLNLAAGLSRNPRTGQLEPPRFLGGGTAEIPAGTDRRLVYARWLTAADNPHFSRGLVNRIWSYFFHRGIIDPVDDIRTTNPPINRELLEVLTGDFVQHKFDVRHLMRTIVTSRTYQRSSVPNDGNRHDRDNFSHALPRRLPAEALLDSLVQATGVPERIGGAPAGFTAAQLPDANVQSEFLALFGKPQRMEACECERDAGSNMLQSLHFINGKSILSRVAAPNGRAAQLLKEKLPDEKLIEQLYLWTLVRPPTAEEIKVAVKFFSSYPPEKKNEAVQDLMWALLCSRDFMLVH